MDERPDTKETAKIKVHVVGDHPIMLAGVAANIHAKPDMTVVAMPVWSRDHNRNADFRLQISDHTVS
jgi:hypothetical protein